MCALAGWIWCGALSALSAPGSHMQAPLHAWSGFAASFFHKPLGFTFSPPTLNGSTVQPCSDAFPRSANVPEIKKSQQLSAVYRIQPGNASVAYGFRHFQDDVCVIFGFPSFYYP